ncbi:MAG: hypothetical protein R2710_14145 [Acidimicrobiales bacterium]
MTEFANELEWLPAEDNGAVSHYLVYRSVDGAEFEVVHETPVAWTEWQDLSVEPNRTYAYYLRAVDLAGNIGWRNGIVAVSTGPAEDSAPPTFTRFGSAGATAAAITMGWEVSDNVGVTGLSLSVYDTDGVLVAVAHPPVDTASYTVNGLRSATRYFFVLEARDAAGNVGTNRTSAWTESIRPEPVRNMAAVATAEGVALSWDVGLGCWHPRVLGVPGCERWRPCRDRASHRNVLSRRCGREGCDLQLLRPTGRHLWLPRMAQRLRRRARRLSIGSSPSMERTGVGGVSSVHRPDGAASAVLRVRR